MEEGEGAPAVKISPKKPVFFNACKCIVLVSFYIRFDKLLATAQPIGNLRPPAAIEMKKKKGGPFPFSPTLFDACHAANGKYIFENCPQIRANYTRRSRTSALKSRLYGHLRLRTRLHDVFKVGVFIWIKVSQYF